MPRPRQYQEEQVLDAIMETFWEHGYEATSAQDLVDATGLTRSSLYNAFVNKQGLFEQALIRYKTRTAQFVEKLDSATEKKKGIRALLLDMIETDLHSTNKRGCLITNTAIEQADKDVRITQLVNQNLRMLESALERNIVHAQHAGEITTTTKAKVLASCLLNTIQGLRVLAKTTPKKNRHVLIDIIDTTISSLL